MGVKNSIKPTKKLEQERLDFNRRYRKGQAALTMEQYIAYVTGKGLPTTAVTTKRKPLKATGLPSWANNPYTIPSAAPTEHIAVRNSIMERLDKESDEVRAAILKKKNQIALPYSKGAYQFISDPELSKCLGRKL